MIANSEYDDLHRLTSETLPLNDYSAKILPHNPVAYWRFGEIVGSTAYDSSGNGYDIAYNDTYTLGEPGLTGDSNKSLRIPTQGAGYAGTTTLAGVSVTGVEAWFQTDSTANHREIVSLSNAYSPRFTISHKKSSGYVAVAGGQYGSEIMASDAPVSSNEPHHVAVWYEPGSNTTYMMVDGVVQQATYGGNVFNFGDATVYIGAFKQGSSAYKRYLGEIDEVAIYDGAMSASTFANRVLSPDVFAYDANGNRTSHNYGTPTTLTYQSLSNELATIDSVSVAHDAAGNRTAEPGGLRTYGYNDRGRLISVTDNSVLTASYSHNALGQRVKKTVGSTDTVSVYDLGGNLIAEHDGSGNLVRDYVWMNGVPVAQIDSGETFTYLHTDHLGTPRLATNDSQTVVWTWDSDAFGEGLPDEDPDGDSTSTTVNLRFPGQYFDGESGLHYNYFRTLDPATGRYLESDPIGLLGGLNTYAYVGSNPLSYYDPYGLLSMDDVYGAIYNATDGWSPSQGAVDFWAGFGDGVSSVFTLGFYSTADLREDLDIDGGVDECSWTYKGSKLAGYGWGAATIGLASGPRGPLFGRARYRNGNAGIFNRGNTRVGWSWNQSGWAGSRNYFGVHGGRPGSAGHWHRTPLPGPRGPGW
jgi:RHS repeat-associated protein